MIFTARSCIRCICGVLKNKPRILVTHQLQYLKAADQILVLKEVSPHVPKLHAQYLPSYKRNAPVHVCFTLQHNWASCKNHSYEHAVVHIQVIHSFPQTCRMKPVQVVLSLIRKVQHLFFYSINTTLHAHVSVFLIRYCWVACTSKMKIKINQLHTKVTLFLNKSQ